VPLTIRQYLADAHLRREEIDRFFDGEGNWARFDAELGYLLRSSMVRDGEDGCWTISTYAESGERRMGAFADRPCRINTYGDSFTQCHQVSDGETWQERLAAHFGEPIRNFGIGGFGVWQAYRRLLRHEQSDTSAPYLVLNLYDDDHYRSIDAWRLLRIQDFRRYMRDRAQYYFHANPWTHLRLGTNGRFQEMPNPYPSREALYRLCDPEHVYEVFSKDIIMNLEMAKRGGEHDRALVAEVADALGVRFRSSDPATAARVHTVYALRSSQYIVENLLAWAVREGRKVLLMLSYGFDLIDSACRGRPRFDSSLVVWLREHTIPFVDAWEAHTADFRSMRVPVEAYLRRYYIGGNGHYNPKGNLFFAATAKRALLDWVDPKPITYRGEGASAAELAALLT